VLFHLDRGQPLSLQVQLKQHVVAAILDGRLKPGEPLPSCRHLADRLDIARNTVMLAYQQLVDEGYLEPRARSGYFVSPDIMTGRVQDQTSGEAARALSVDSQAMPSGDGKAPDWQRRFKLNPTAQRNIDKPRDWQKAPYPFIAGQVDPALFPIAAWRDCSRLAMGVKAVNEWTVDLINRDDPILIDQIRARALPRRGIAATADEILVTVGAQQALYLIAALMVRETDRVAVEEPGYVDARNIFRIKTPHLVPVPVDAEGIQTDPWLEQVDYVYVTPSHQHPTTVTLSRARRKRLLDLAAERRFVVIEDDYEIEANYAANPSPALKSMDADGRVIYVGSMSKLLAPGLRLGYVVGPAPVIAELRALRRLMVRHPPANNQRTVALFLANGHFDALINRLNKANAERWRRLREAMARHMPGFTLGQGSGGTSLWVSGSEGFDGVELAARARAEGVIIEAGDVFYEADPAPRNHVRIGFSAIPVDRIEPGIARLAAIAKTLGA
jgi:GntR family transcriptional regulator/MocR family aminotransferase